MKHTDDIITPHGIYKYLRLHFGLNVSSEIFQNQLNKALEGLQGAICITDGILIVGCGEAVEEAEKDYKNKLKQSLTDTGIMYRHRDSVKPT